MAKIKSYPDALRLFARNIKKYRTAKGLTQEDMVDLGFNYRFYQRLESGRHSPNLQTLFRLSEAFAVPISKLLE